MVHDPSGGCDPQVENHCFTTIKSCPLCAIKLCCFIQPQLYNYSFYVTGFPQERSSTCHILSCLEMARLAKPPWAETTWYLQFSIWCKTEGCLHQSIPLQACWKPRYVEVTYQDVFEVQCILKGSSCRVEPGMGEALTQLASLPRTCLVHSSASS